MRLKSVSNVENFKGRYGISVIEIVSVRPNFLHQNSDFAISMKTKKTFGRSPILLQIN